MTAPHVIALGSINMDMQSRTERWPDSGETLLAEDFLMTGGGKAANVAVLARKLGANATLIGRVGDDVLADGLLRQLEQADVDLAHVQRVPGSATAVSMIFVKPGGEKTIILAANANMAWDEARDADAVRSAIASAPPGSVLVVDLEVPEAIVRVAMAAAHERLLPIVLDPSPADRATNDLLQYASVIVPNTSEARQLTGVTVDSNDAAMQAGQDLLRRGIPTVCQKLDGGGCVVVTQNGVDLIRPVPVDVVDQTGAGDAFAGGMGVALAEGKTGVDAAVFAVAASHLAVTAYGSQEAYPSRETLDDMVARLGHETIE